MLIFCASLWVSCEEPEDNSSGNIDSNPDLNDDTFDEDLSGANLQDLFFNLENQLDYTYDYYTVDGIGYSNTIEAECSLRETDIVSFYTFPEYLIEAFNCNDDNNGVICNEDNIDYDIYVNEFLLDETYGDVCECWCLDENDEIIDCNSNEVVSRKYQASPSIIQVCQNSTYTTQNECEVNGWVWFDHIIDCSLMDANQDCAMDKAEELDIVNVESADFSVTYTNVEKMYWDVESNPPKYKTQVSLDQILEHTVTDSSDTYDTSVFWTIINEWDAENIDGMVYIDHAQWNDTTITHEEQPEDENDVVDVILEHTFEYERSIMNRDSLTFKSNSDCNNDGIWTEAESYDDFGTDGCPDAEEDGSGGCDGGGLGDDPNNDNWEEGDDPVVKTEGNNEYDEGEPFSDREDNFTAAEIFWDENGDGERSAGEPYADLNCNGFYDVEWVDDGTINGNGIWDDDEIFQDINGNDIWDEQPCYVDLNNNGQLDEDETSYDAEPLQKVSSLPDQIIVNYDTNGDGVYDQNDDDPVVLIDIDPDAINEAVVFLSSENGGYHHYVNFIQNISAENYQYAKYTPIERIETIYSNEIIENVPEDLISDDYYVTKTYWETLPNGTDVNGDDLPDRFYDYDYHLFGYDDNNYLTKLIHPAYFYHYGYFETPDEIEDGFYETSDLIKEILMYTVDGELRTGEVVSSFEEVSVDSNNDGVDDMIYEVSKVFEVVSENITVPLRKNLGIQFSETEANGEYDEGEDFIDEGNCIWDDAHCTNDYFIDQENCEFAGWEWINAEVYVDTNGNGEYDEGEEFTDQLNGVWDECEEFSDYSDYYNCAETTPAGGDMVICAADGTTSCIGASQGSDPTLGENECSLIYELTDCSADTTYTNAYKVIRTKNILMIGNGVEFGERNSVWLVPGIGIVMDKLEHRWTEDYWSEDDALVWKEFSRLELKSTETSLSSNILDRLFNNGKIININELQNEGSLNNDPYIPKPTGIIQRVRLPHE